MTKTVTKRQKVQMPAGIRNKLMASVSMLLVAGIMMVSSTYAWFTLSTAPEVKGITTNVGANGNLEITLLNNTSYASSADDLGIVSAVGDSMEAKPVTQANATWGNLVTLSDPSYGLDSIVLNPAVLNVTKTQSDKITGGLLMAPRYGSDGRVIGVDKETVTGTYGNGGFTYDTAAAGVRAIGLSSGVTQRISLYNSAKAQVLANSNSAKAAAVNSLTSNGQTLANIMMQYVNDPAATFSNKDVASLETLVSALKTANNYAGTAIKYAVLANSLSKDKDKELTDKELTDKEVSALRDAILAAEVDSLSGVEGAIVPANLGAAVASWSAVNTSLTSAQDTLDGLSGNSYTYAQLSPAVEALVNKDYVGINGYAPISRNKQDIINAISANGFKVVMVMKDGSGVYDVLANMVGNYTAAMKLDVSMGSISATLDTTMSTNATPDNQIASITIGDAPEAGVESGNTVIADTYGYAIDFGFRTNAAGSSLLLQTKEANRVYTDGGTVTQGGGSYLEFHSADTNLFSVDEIRALMSAIRVVFVTPDGTVLGMAAADITRSVAPDTGVATYEGGEPVGDDGLKATLSLYEYTVAEPNILTLSAKAESGKLIDLTQNVAQKVTAIVYLDGDYVDNTMVANAETSMTGALNLQFASDATLTPMENSALRNGTATEVTYTQVAAAGASYPFGSYTGRVNEYYAIYNGSDGKVYFKKTSEGTYTELTLNNYSTAITVTVTGT